jgi:hypothetical protein
MLSGGQSQKIAISATSASTAVLTSSSYLLSVDVDCFGRMGLTPVAVSDGTDQIFMAGNTYRIVPVVPGYKLALITTSATGSAYLTPDA